MGTMASLMHPVARGSDRLLARAAVALIRVYQRWLSPVKGFRCAHNALNGSGSCSQFGARAISELGFARGVGQLKIRLDECRVAAEQLMQNAHEASEEDKNKKEGTASRAADWCTLSSGCIPTEGSCSGGASSARGAGGCIKSGCSVDSCF